MRGATTGLKVLVPLATLLCGIQAMAQDGAYKEVMGWSIYRNATNCSAYMMFDNNEAVGFTYDAPGRSTRVTFSDANAVSLEDVDNPTIDILLRQTDGTVDTTWESTVFLVSEEDDGRRTLSSRWLGPPALDNFRNAAVIGFYDEDREIGVFSLRGSAAALAEVEQCSTRLRNGRS